MSLETASSLEPALRQAGLPSIKPLVPFAEELPAVGRLFRAVARALDAGDCAAAVRQVASFRMPRRQFAVWRAAINLETAAAYSTCLELAVDRLGRSVAARLLADELILRIDQALTLAAQTLKHELDVVVALLRSGGDEARDFVKRLADAPTVSAAADAVVAQARRTRPRLQVVVSNGAPTVTHRPAAALRVVAGGAT